MRCYSGGRDPTRKHPSHDWSKGQKAEGISTFRWTTSVHAIKRRTAGIRWVLMASPTRLCSRRWRPSSRSTTTSSTSRRYSIFTGLSGFHSGWPRAGSTHAYQLSQLTQSRRERRLCSLSSSRRRRTTWCSRSRKRCRRRRRTPPPLPSRPPSARDRRRRFARSFDASLPITSCTRHYGFENAAAHQRHSCVPEFFLKLFTPNTIF